MNLLSRGRTRLRVSLLVAIAVCAVSLSVAPSASATTFSALLGNQQAGSETNLTWLWSSLSAPTPASDVSVVLTHGYLARSSKMGSECTREMARTAGCPTASRLGTVMTVHNSPGALPVVSRGYVALKRRRAGEFNGFDVLVVLDRPSARYRRSVGIGRIEFNTATADPTTVFDLGAPRLEFADGRPSPAQLVTFGFTGQKGWLRNPTQCGSGATIGSITTFADGSSETVTRSPSISGCDSLTVDTPLDVQFNPREISIDKSRSWSATARIGTHADGERTTDPRTIRMKMMGAPKIGEATAVFTTSCTHAQAEAAACPPQSRLGEFCVEGSPAGEIACGDAWVAGVHQPGSAAGGGGGSVGLLLSLTKFSGGSGGGGGGAGGLLWVGDGSVQIVPGTGQSILTINDLPQVDVHAFRMSGNNPLFEANSNCGSNPLHTRVTGWNGVARDATGVTAIACSPGIETTDARDADSDGDGIADKQWRPANFEVNFRVSDRGEGVDPSSISCSFKGWDGTIKGSPRVDDSDDDGLDDGCSISSATGGDGVLEIRAADWRGHVTVLKLGYSIDVWLPALLTIEPIDGDADGDGVADDEFREPNFSMAFEATDEGSGIDDDATTCGAEDQQGTRLPKITPKIAKESHGKFRCMVEGADDGPIVIVATVRDVTGHVTVLKRQATVDSQGPVVITTEPEDDDCDGESDEVALSCFRPAFFDVFFSATDAGAGVDWITNTCAVRLLGGAVPGGAVLQTARVVDTDDDGTPDACRIENAPEGDVEVDIRAADWRGHVTVLKLSYTVDTTPPAIAIDEPGAHFAPGAFFDIFTDLGFTIDGLRGHRDVGGYRCAFHLEGDFDSISRPTSNCAPAGDGGPPALQLRPGLNHAQLRVMDAAGNVSEAFFDIFYDTVGPVIELTDGGDRDCDDSDGELALTCFRPAFFDVFFSASDAGVGVDWSTAACRGVIVRRPGSMPVNGRFIDDDEDGVPEGCGFDGLEEEEYDVEISVADWRGHVTVLKLHYGVDNTPPTGEFTGPMDQDVDGDSVADQPYRVGSFDIPISLADTGGSGIDPATSSCELSLIGGALPGGAVISAAVSMVDTNSDGDADACRVSDAPAGRLQVELVIRDRAGNSSDPATSVMREWIVDTTPSEIAIDEPGVHFTADAFFDVFSEIGFRIDGMRPGDPGLDGYGCDFHLEGDFDSISRPTSNCAPAGDLGGPPALQLEPGSNRIMLVVEDPAGNLSTSFFDVFFDIAPPRIFPDPATEDPFVDAPTFGVGVTAVAATFTVPSSERSTICWILGGADGSIRLDGSVIVTGGLNETLDFTCEFENVPDGSYEFHVVVTDAAGLEDSYSRPLTVDTDAPAVQFFNPGSQPFVQWPPLAFAVDDANPGHSVCSLVDLATGAAVGEDEDCDGYADGAGRPCEPDDPIGSGLCRRSFVMPHVLEKSGRYRATVVHTDLAGNAGTASVDFTIDVDGPVVATTEPIDDDCDGLTDDTSACYRPAFFDVFYSVRDDGFGVDWTTNTCAVRLLGGAIPGGAIVSARVVDVDRDGRPDLCRVEGAPDGEYEVEIRAADWRGHVTVLKLSYTVDTTPPVIELGYSTARTTQNTSFGERVGVNDVNGTEFVTCGVATGAGAAACTSGDCSAVPGDDPATPSSGEYECLAHSDSEGLFRYRIVATDFAGNSSTAFFDVFFDRTAPAVTPLNPIDDDDDDDGYANGVYRGSTVAIDYELSDSSEDLAGLALRPGVCTARPIADGSGELSHAALENGAGKTRTCSFTGLAEGVWEISLAVADQAGNTGSHRVLVIVDSSPPEIAIDDSGVHFTGGAFFDVFSEIGFTIDGMRPGDPGLDPYRCTFNLDGDFDSISRPTSNCAPGGPIELPEGLNHLGVRVRDAAGNATDAFFDVFVDLSGPAIALTDTKDEDCDDIGDPADPSACFRPAFFDVFFTATDAGAGVDWSTASCRGIVGKKPVSASNGRLIDENRDGVPEGCGFDGLEDENYDVEISVADWRGHVTVLKLHYGVDTTPPAIAVTSYPFDPDIREMVMVAQFDVSDRNPGVSTCELTRSSHGETEMLFLDRCDGFALPTGEACDPADSSIPDCRRSFVLPHVLEGSGTFVGRITHTDAAGNSSTEPFEYTVPPVAAPSITFEDAPAITNNPRPAIPFSITNGDPQGSTLCEVLPEVGDEVLVGFVWNCGGTWTGSSCDCAAEVPTDLPDGSYRLRVTHTRASGDSSPAVHSWLVDITRPDIVFETFGGDPIQPGQQLLTTNPDPEATFVVSETAKTVCALDKSASGDTPAEDLDFQPCTLSVRLGPSAGGDTAVKNWCFRVRATDDAGNTSDAKLCFTIEPRFVFSSPADYDGDEDGLADEPLRPADFDVAFVVEGDPSGETARSAKCTVRGWDPKKKEPILGVLDTNGDSVPDTCRVEDAPSGDLKIALNSPGHKTVSELSFVVDADIPEVEFFSPGSEPFDGSRWPWPAPKPGRFKVTDANPGSSRCQIIDAATGETLEDRDCDDFADSAGEACEPRDPTVTGCERYFGIPQIAQPSGAYLIRVVHTDAAGNEGSASLNVAPAPTDPPTT